MWLLEYAWVGEKYRSYEVLAVCSQILRPVRVHGEFVVVVAHVRQSRARNRKRCEDQKLWLALLAMQKGEDRGRKFLPSLEEVELQDEYETEQFSAQFLDK